MNKCIFYFISSLYVICLPLRGLGLHLLFIPSAYTVRCTDRLTFSKYIYAELVRKWKLSIYNGEDTTWAWLGLSLWCPTDSIDGKHARRTQSSSPLGELFDHGLDSWATSIFSLSFFSVFGLCKARAISAYTLYCILCVVLVTFVLSHWEKYNTGVLFLPWGYDFSQVVSTGILSLGWWDKICTEE